MDKSKQLCYDCRWCIVDEGEAAWSEVTPGCDGSLYCQKGHWSVDVRTMVGLRDFIKKAPTCPDYGLTRQP